MAQITTMKSKIEFFIGVIPEDKSKFLDFAEKIKLDIKDEYDDPYGYYTYVIDGTWEEYELVSKEKGFVKSLEHFEAWGYQVSVHTQLV